MAKTVVLPELLWDGPGFHEIWFPDSWQVKTYRMVGHHAQSLSSSLIESALEDTIECPPLRELAVNKKRVAILFDDKSRPARPSRVLPFVLRELHRAGVAPDQVRFICALGAHGAHDYRDFVQKLGKDVVAEYPVYNHNPFENCEYVGTTRDGVRIEINKEVMKCDLKIGLGGVMPHGFVGFSGGGKILMPGVASIDTANAFHDLDVPGLNEAMLGDTRRAALRQCIEESVQLSGLDLKIDFLFNAQGEACDLFCGHPVAEYQAAVEVAMKHYASPWPDPSNVVVANAFVKSTQADLALTVPFKMFSESEDGIVVLVMNSPIGQMPHYLMRSFGTQIGGRLWRIRSEMPAGVTLVIYSSQKDPTAFDSLESQDDLVWLDDWEKVIAFISERVTMAQVAILPDATLQIFQKDRRVPRY